MVSTVLTVAPQTGKWQYVALGSGGQLTSLDIAPDGTMVCCLDTHGAVVWEANAYAPGYPGGRGKWRRLVTKKTIPSMTVPLTTDGGGYSIRVAPSNSNRFYLYLSDGYLYRTDDRCATPFVRTNFAKKAAHGNSDTKFIRYKMAVDPVNADVLFVGTPGNGGLVTADAGNTWSAVPTVAAATAYYGSDAGQGTGNMVEYRGGNLWAFDPTSATSGSPLRTQVLYAGSYGVGVYKSSDAGASWTLLNSSGMPTLPTCMQVDSTGVLWVSDGTYLNKYDPNTNTWSKFADATLVSLGKTNITWFAVCPTDPNKVFCGDNGSFFYTPNGGTSFTNNRMSGASTKTANDHPYLSRISPTTVGNCVWGPDNNLYMAEGIGVWKITEAGLNAAHNFAKPPMTSISAGIENLVVNWIISPPGKNPVFACMDRPFFSLPNVRTFPTDYGPNYSGTDIKEGYSLDYASSNPDFIVGCWAPGFVVYGTPSLATSSDGGRTPTWTTVTWSGVKSSGGCVAALTPQNWIWVEANGQAGNVGAASGGRVWYTTDGGANFAESTTPLGFSNGWYLQNAFNSLRRQMVCADRVNGCFYMYNSGSVAPGFYRSTDGGANFTLACAGKTDTNGPSNFNFQMRAVPPYSGYTGGRFFATSGSNDDDSIISNPFYSCVDNNDGTITKTAVTGVTNVWSFGYGKPKPGGSGVPAIFIRGNVDATRDLAGVGGYGVWRSDDFGTSWAQLSDLFPMDSLDHVHVVSGDMNVYGRCYVGMGGTGVLMYDP